MYIEHFGLAQYPFSLTPNTRYFLKLPSHQRAFDFIIATLQSEARFTKITGEIGTGKTMLCRKVLNALEVLQNRYLTAFIPNPVLDEEAIMFAIAEEMSLDFDPGSSYYELLKLISEALVRLSKQSKTTVLLIDEAQAMPEESLEALRLLTKVENVDGIVPLHIVLFAQPELDEVLARPAHRDLNNELSDSAQLTALDAEGVEAYLAHRLAKAGFSGTGMFTDKATALLHRSSKGIPRLINILAHKALLAAFGRGDHTIDEEHIQLAIEDTDSVRNERLRMKRLFRNAE